MPLDPFLAMQAENLRPYRSFPEMFADPEGRAALARYESDAEPYVAPGGVSTDERSVLGPHGPIRVRIYRPEQLADDAPGLLWMHGGAFQFGDIDMPESWIVCHELAARAGAVTVTVDYRLARDGVRFPVPLDDVEAAWQWFVIEAAALGADPARLSIGGASAGGNLATAATMRVRDGGGTLPRSMLLAYPLVHHPVPPLGEATLLEMSTFPAPLHSDGEFAQMMLLNYLGTVDEIPAGYAPGNFDLTGMPAAFIAPDEYDTLRPSGELLADELRALGIPVELQLAEGMLHGHLNRTPALAAVDRTLDFFADALRA